MSHKAVQVYDSSKKIPFNDILEVIQYRFLIKQLIRRDVLTRYKRSLLGVAWTMLNPLGTMVILSIVFSNIFRSTENYAVYVLTGIIAWNFFSKSTNAAMGNMVWGGSLISRIYLPPTVFSISAIGTEVINLFLSLVPLVLVLLVLQFKLTIAVIFLPVSIVLLAAFSLGLALAVSRFAVFFPDVAEMYQIILTAWMYLTPIIIPYDMFPQQFIAFLNLNPMTWLVQLFRAPIYYGRFPTWEEFLISLAWALGMLLVGWLLFRSKRDDYAYRV